MGQQSSTPQSARAESDQPTHIDGGALKLENGVYTGAHDWKRSVVRAQQLARRLAPYYKGLDDYDDDWTDEHLIAGLKAQLTDNPYNISLLSSVHDPACVNTSQGSTPSRPSSFVETGTTTSTTRPRAATVDSSTNVQRVARPRVPFGVLLYKNAVECPICFLYYPSNIATTRCCRQPICTECFVQIKRPNPHAPIVHADDPNPPPELPDTLVMEAPVCPYCNESDFGVIYEPPDFGKARGFVPVPASERDVPAADPRVVLTDHIRPDWTAKLQRAKDRAARRAANAALITAHLQRQERRAQAAEYQRAMASNAGSSARTSRRSAMEAFEEAQLAEAIRLSVLEDEERQRRQAEEEAKARSISTASTSRPVAVSRKSSHSVHRLQDEFGGGLTAGGASNTRQAHLNDTLNVHGGRSPESYNPHAPGPGSMPLPDLIYAPPPDSFNPPIEDYLSRRRLNLADLDEDDDDDGIEEGVGRLELDVENTTEAAGVGGVVARSLDRSDQPGMQQQRANNL